MLGIFSFYVSQVLDVIGNRFMARGGSLFMILNHVTRHFSVLSSSVLLCVSCIVGQPAGKCPAHNEQSFSTVHQLWNHLLVINFLEQFKSFL